MIVFRATLTLTGTLPVGIIFGPVAALLLSQYPSAQDRAKQDDGHDGDNAKYAGGDDDRFQADLNEITQKTS